MIDRSFSYHDDGGIGHWRIIHTSLLRFVSTNWYFPNLSSCSISLLSSGGVKGWGIGMGSGVDMGVNTVSDNSNGFVKAILGQ